MTKEKWKQMTEEEHEMYWERHYALWRAVLLPPGNIHRVLYRY